MATSLLQRPISIASTRTLVFFDPSLDDLDTLISGLNPGVKSHILEANRDGIEQISELLAQQPTTSVTLVCHGFAGGLRLGSNTLELSNLSGYTGKLSQWFQPKTQSTLTLLSCQTARGDVGAEFVAKLQSITGAQVAADSNFQGNGQWLPAAKQLFSTTVLADYPHRLNWQTVGETGFSAGIVDATEIAFDNNNTPYIVYANYADGGKATVQKFDGSSWQTVGTAGLSVGEAPFTDLEFDDSNTPYVVYRDIANGGKVTVQKFDGSSWQVVGQAAFSPGNTTFTDLEFAPDSTPYVSYADENNGGKVTVQKFDGSTWQSVGIAGFSSGAAAFVDLQFDGSGTPYVIYSDASNEFKVVVKKFESGSWQLVGADGFSAGYAAYSQLAFDSGGTPYVVYSDGDNGGSVTVQKLSGNSWQVVGNAGFSADRADFTELAFDRNDVPYVVYKDASNSGKATVQKFADGLWQVAGIAGFSSGGVGSADLAFNDLNQPYVAYTDLGNGSKATVQQLEVDPKPVIEFSTETFSVNEGGGASTVITLVRSGDLSQGSVVRVRLTSGSASDNDYNNGNFPMEIVFSPSETSKVVTIPITDDDIAETSESLSLNVESIANAVVGNRSVATLTIQDNDAAGFSLSKTDLTISENGTEEEVIVKLLVAPRSEVVFEVSSSDEGEAIASPSRLTLNSTNWNTGVAFRVTGVNDAAIDGSQLSQITVSVNEAESDDLFGSLTAKTVDVTTTDNDQLIDPEAPTSKLTPIFGGKLLEVTRLVTDNTVRLSPLRVNIDDVSEILVFSTNATGGNLVQIGSFSLLTNDRRLADYKPTITLTAGQIEEGTNLQFELIRNGLRQVATVSENASGEIILSFGNEVLFEATATIEVATTNLMIENAAAIDLSEEPGLLNFNFSVYREASFNNKVGLYKLNDAKGSVTDALTGETFLPGDDGYKEAAISQQLAVELTGQNGQRSDFATTLAGGGFLGLFLVVNGMDAATHEVFFSYAQGNSDKRDHVKHLGDNTFGFEDLVGMGDQDYNDIVVRFEVAFEVT